MELQRELFAMSERLKALDITSNSQEYEFPLEHIIECIEDVELQLRHNRKAARKRYGASINHDAEDCFWFYFESPQWTWENLCGSARWMVLSKSDLKLIDFSLEIMN